MICTIYQIKTYYFSNQKWELIYPDLCNNCRNLQEEEGQQYDKVSEQEANGTSAYKVTSPKKQKYKVNQNEDIYSEVKKHKNEDIYSEVKKHKRPASSKSSDKTRYKYKKR